MSDTEGWKGRRAATPGKAGVLVDAIRSLQRQVAELRTRATLNSASISSGGLRIKDGGDVTVEDGGQLQVLGTAGERIRFVNGRMYLRYDAGDVEGRISAGLASDGVRPAMWLLPPSVSTPADPNENSVIVVGRDPSDGGALFFRTAGRMQGIAEEDLYFVGQTGVILRADAGTAYLDAPAGDARVAAGGDARVTAEGDAQVTAGGNAWVMADGDVVLQPADGKTVWAHLETNTGTANVLYGGGTTGIGALWKTGSSLRYKQDVEDLDLSHLSADQIVDALHGRTWRDRGEVARNPDTTERIPGHIAEELHDAGLVAFVIYDERGRPDGVAYDRLSGALAQALRTTRDELAVERARIDALERAVAALAAPPNTEPEGGTP